MLRPISHLPWRRVYWWVGRKWWVNEVYMMKWTNNGHPHSHPYTQLSYTKWTKNDTQGYVAVDNNNNNNINPNQDWNVNIYLKKNDKTKRNKKRKPKDSNNENRQPKKLCLKVLLCFTSISKFVFYFLSFSHFERMLKLLFFTKQLQHKFDFLSARWHSHSHITMNIGSY